METIDETIYEDFEEAQVKRPMQRSDEEGVFHHDVRPGSVHTNFQSRIAGKKRVRFLALQIFLSPANYSVETYLEVVKFKDQSVRNFEESDRLNSRPVM